jgi:cytochrome c553
MRIFTALLMVACVCRFGNAVAAEPAAAKADPGQAQQIVTKVCAACHGADGNSSSSANPSLAGQHADYIAKQLAEFKSGQRKNPVMLGMTASLSPADMKNLGLYFESQKPKPRAARNAELVKIGQQIYRGGVVAKGIAACASCHGPNGAGMPAQFPRLAGQYAEYTIAQLQAFRTAERGNDPLKMMRMTAAKLSDQEIQAVAEYLAGLR